MDNKRLEDKVDKIADSISEINVTLAKQSVILEEHVRRSTNLENRLEPIEKHVHMVSGAMKLAGLLAILAGIVEALVKLLGLTK